MSDKISVLYIDDNELDRELVRDALEREHGGFELLEAGNRDEFLEMLQSTPVDLVISDFNILGFEGFDVIRATEDIQPGLPVVIVTGTGSEEIAVKALKQGAWDYVIKQTGHIRRLPQTLLQVLEKKRLHDDHEKAEQARDAALTRLELATRFGGVGLWDWDLKTDDVIFSREWLEQIGYREGELTHSYEEWESRLHPDDRDRVRQELRDYLKQQTNPYNIEFRLQHKDGSYRWINAVGEVIRDSGGKPERMLGCHLDITARRIAEEELLAALREKDILLREVHHRVKNNLQIVSSLLSLQEKEFDNPQLKEVLKLCRNRVMVMAQIHETLHESDNLAAVDMKDYLSSILVSVIQSLSVNRAAPEAIVEIEAIRLPMNKAIPIGQVVNELVSNAVLHGFENTTAPQVKIILKQAGGDIFNLWIEDNGVGMPPDFDWRTSQRLGLKLVRILVEEQLDGTIALDRSNGTRFTIRFGE